MISSIDFSRLTGRKIRYFSPRRIRPRGRKKSYFSHGFSIYHSAEKEYRIPKWDIFLQEKNLNRRRGLLFWGCPSLHVDFRWRFQRYVWGQKKRPLPSQMSPEITLSIDSAVLYHSMHRWCPIYNDLGVPLPLPIGKCI